MCFVRISEQTTIISLYNMNLLIFITQRECVYCAVRTGSLSIKQICFVFKGLNGWHWVGKGYHWNINVGVYFVIHV
jgi:hypothetical protein